MKTLSILLTSGLLSFTTLTTLQAQQLTSSERVSESISLTSSGSGQTEMTGSSVMLIRYEVLYSPVQRHTFVNWQTISEVNNHHFEIERSINGQTFKKIGQVAAISNSQTINYYKFTDTTPLAGRNYYRLKQVGNDSSFTYSRVISATTRRVSQAIAVTLSPNPCVNGNCDVKLANVNPGTPTTVELLDDNGRMLLSRNISDTNTAMPLSANDVGNRKGIFYLRIISGDEVAMQRVVFD